MPRLLEELTAVILTHRDAPLDVVGSFESRVGEAYQILRGVVDEAVVLATCNRFEVYALPRRGFVETVIGFLGEASRYARILHGMDVVRHLFRVAAGLESAIIGENEILGQVARAYEEARRRGVAGKYLGLLFSQAVRTGKLVRSRTRISYGNVGAPGAAVKLAREAAGGFDGKHVVVVGAGEAGSIMASLVREEAPTARISIVNRSVDRARELAGKVRGEAYGLDMLPKLLAAADVVLVAVTVNEPVIKRSMLEDVGRHLVVVDISNPPAVEQPIPSNVYYAGLRDVEKVIKEVLAVRIREVPKAEAIVEEQVALLRKLWLKRGADEAIAEIMRYANRVMEEEVEELVSRLRGLGVDGAALLVARSFAYSLTKKLLRPLILYAHEAALEGSLSKLEEIAQKYRDELARRQH
ncbi:glutamyl-tRNA reductase [Hyperthermus butylicus]|uniref:Glutamyl-tRNA reductase n=1 Tax=Hyperthermus butylicus (strain DSM 5456 / JCM 9403 / PLM1-5) TaxID=415426 RepID=HEM1_HYPBU|nr:glutamyl-tRNA reductase [Hyperthermus butylicus]A2BJB7.1 RecName: Full=Glutamyl-tRNA reductase; Short=GluTR [Hyperthermus butylicus DSM 5456]ABM80078.1 glutamyl-tRNAglu reductase [Hyperthermus butylicus DSM 5456]